MNKYRLFIKEQINLFALTTEQATWLYPESNFNEETGTYNYDQTPSEVIQSLQDRREAAKRKLEVTNDAINFFLVNRCPVHQMNDAKFYVDQIKLQQDIEVLNQIANKNESILQELRTKYKPQ